MGQGRITHNERGPENTLRVETARSDWGELARTAEAGGNLLNARSV